MKYTMQEIAEYDSKHSTSFIRELEMAVDACTDSAGIKTQFFTDLRMYGIDETIRYFMGYDIETRLIATHVEPISRRIKIALSR